MEIFALLQGSPVRCRLDDDAVSGWHLAARRYRMAGYGSDSSISRIDSSANG